MDKVVRVCTGGPVSQIGSGADFGGMEVIVLVFRESLVFRTLVTRIKSTFGWDEPGSLSECKAYQVRSLEVVVERTSVGEDLRMNLDVVNCNMEELESVVDLSQGPHWRSNVAPHVITSEGNHT